MSPKAETKTTSPKAKGKKDKGGEKAAEEPAKEKTPEEKAEDRKKQLKKVQKEGGKRGVEIEGAADMGGLKFFCTSVDEPMGDLEFMDACMTAMNQKCDPTEEERKGCSGHIGKMIFSAGEEQLAICAYVPDEMKKDIDAKVWMQKVVGLFGGEVV